MGEQNAGLTKFEITDEQIDGDDYFAVIEPLHVSVSIYDDAATYERDLARFSLEQRNVFACHWYLSEVNNGGHDQFFDNSTGIVWQDAQAGFQAMGLTEIASIVAEAGLRLGGRPSLDREEREEQLETSDARFDDLDHRLFDFERAMDLNEQFLSYIRKHRDKFYFSGYVEEI